MENVDFSNNSAVNYGGLIYSQNSSINANIKLTTIYIIKMIKYNYSIDTIIKTVYPPR